MYPKYLEKGMEFGRLTILYVDEDSKVDEGGNKIWPSQWKYVCKCLYDDCPNVSVAKRNLITGGVRSCGCLRRERSPAKNRKRNPIEDCGDYIKVFFFNKDHGYFIIDKEDYGKIANYCWHRKSSKNSFYALSSKNKHQAKTMRVHQIICPCEEGFMPDHKDGDGLNNRKSNLRQATRSQNNMNVGIRANNSSGQTGVAYREKYNKWEAYICVDYESTYIGSFTTFEEAKLARLKWEMQLHKAFSPNTEVHNVPSV